MDVTLKVRNSQNNGALVNLGSAVPTIVEFTNNDGTNQSANLTLTVVSAAHGRIVASYDPALYGNASGTINADPNGNLGVGGIPLVARDSQMDVAFQVAETNVVQHLGQPAEDQDLAVALQLGLYVYGGTPAVQGGDGGGYLTSLPEPFDIESFPLFTGPGGISANDAVTLSGSPSAGWTLSYGTPSWTNPTLCGTYSPQSGSGADGTVTVLPASLANQITAVQDGLATATALTAVQTSIANAYNILNSGTYGNSALQALLNTLVTAAGNLSNLMALENIQGPSQIVLPETGTLPYAYVMVLKGTNNAVSNPDNDTTVAITVTDGSGNSVGSATATWMTAGGLGAVTYTGKLSALSHTGTGWFQFTYTAAEGDSSPLSLTFKGQATIGGVSRNPVLGASVLDANTVSFAASALSIIEKLQFTGSPGSQSVVADASASILVTPANKLATDSSGNVTFNNTGVATAASQTTIIGVLGTPASGHTVAGDAAAAASQATAAATSAAAAATESQLEAAQEAIIEAMPSGGGATPEEIVQYMDENSTRLATIVARTNLITTGNLVIVSGIGKSGELVLYQNAWYDASTKLITLTNPGNWPTFPSGSTVQLQVWTTASPNTVLMTVTGTIVDANTVTFAPQLADMASLTIDPTLYSYDAVVFMGGDAAKPWPLARIIHQDSGGGERGEWARLLWARNGCRDKPPPFPHGDVCRGRCPIGMWPRSAAVVRDRDGDRKDRLDHPTVVVEVWPGAGQLHKDSGGGDRGG